MSWSAIESDQLYDWSVELEGDVSDCVATQKDGASPPNASARCCSARLSDRALQAVRQARVQVCSGTRARPEVLPVRQPAQDATADAVRTEGEPRRSGRALGQPPASAADHRRDLRDQLRVAAPQGTAGLNGPGAAGADGRRGRRCVGGEHDPSVHRVQPVGLRGFGQPDAETVEGGCGASWSTEFDGGGHGRRRR